MTERTFVKTPYSGYHARTVFKEDEELTHVAPGTPGGEYLRRFWQPVCFSADLKDRPRRIRILGEDLVAFRDRSSQVGILQLYCSHRGASLEFGVISEKGLRCCYHGWLYSTDGKIIETPGEPSHSVLDYGLHHGAYPTREYKGIVFTYMGPPDKIPSFPIFDTCEIPGYRYDLTSWVWPCNWVQMRENAMDPAHTYFLHTIISGAQFTQEFGAIPQLEFYETPHGMVYVATRRINDLIWIRICEVIQPNIHQLPSNWNDVTKERIRIRPFLFDWAVPIDDTHTMVIGFYVQPEGSQVDGRKFLEEVPGQSPNRGYFERQSQPGDYEAQVLGRPIAVHALEYLTSNDRGVVMFRRQLRHQIRANKAGDESKLRIARGTGVIPTYAQDTILRILPASGGTEADRKLMIETGKRVLDGFYKEQTLGIVNG